MKTWGNPYFGRRVGRSVSTHYLRVLIIKGDTTVVKAGGGCAAGGLKYQSQASGVRIRAIGYQVSDAGGTLRVTI